MSGSREDVDWRAAYTYLQEQQESILLRVAERLELQERHLRAARRARLRTVELLAPDPATLRSVIVADGAMLTYAFRVFRDERLVREQDFGVSNTLQWQPAAAGAYRVTGLVRSEAATDPPQSADSSTVVVTGQDGAR